MESFRSPLLKAIPHWQDPERQAIIVRRGQVISVLGFLFLVPAAMVWLDLPPKDGWGYWFYWIHDHIFLTIKGNTLTRIQPFGTVLWIILGASFLGWIWSFVSGESLLRPAQVFLARILVRFRFMHQPLLKIATLFSKWGFPPRLLGEVISFERVYLSDRLPGDPRNPPPPDLIDDLENLVRLQVQLWCLPGMTQMEHLRAAQAWTRSLPKLRGRPGSRQLATKLARTLSQSLPKEASEGNLKALELNAFYQDLLHLAALESPDLAARLLGSEMAGRPVAETTALICRQLAISLSDRHEQLNDFQHHLANLTLRHRNSFLGGTIKTPFESIPEELLPLAGSLTVSIALDLAELTRTHVQTQALFDTLDALRLTMSLLEEDQEGMNEDCRQRMSLFLGELPKPRHFRQLARLAEEQLYRRREQWRQSNLAKEGILDANDISLAESRVRHLQQAAGPQTPPYAEVSS